MVENPFQNVWMKKVCSSHKPFRTPGWGTGPGQGRETPGRAPGRCVSAGSDATLSTPQAARRRPRPVDQLRSGGAAADENPANLASTCAAGLTSTPGSPLGDPGGRSSACAPAQTHNQADTGDDGGQTTGHQSDQGPALHTGVGQAPL